MENDQHDDLIQYDDKVARLVDSLDSSTSGRLADVISNPDQMFDAIKAVLPETRIDGGIDWGKAYS